MENKINDDLIIKSGSDYRWMIAGTSETAEWVKRRTKSSLKRTNLLMKYNAYTFFERLAVLRLANIMQYYYNKEVE